MKCLDSYEVKEKNARSKLNIGKWKEMAQLE